MNGADSVDMGVLKRGGGTPRQSDASKFSQKGESPPKNQYDLHVLWLLWRWKNSLKRELLGELQD